MQNFFLQQIDYIYFIYGLSFMVFAAVCFCLHKLPDKKLPWKWLALFAGIHGINEWLDMYAVSITDNKVFQAIRIGIYIYSFFCFMEFNRKLTSRYQPIPGRWVYLLSIPGLLLGWYWSGILGVGILARYTLGFTSGIWACIMLWVGIKSDNYDRTTHYFCVLAGLVGLLYGFTQLVVPPAKFFPACLLNQTLFLDKFGFPIQLVRSSLAVVAAAAGWIYYLFTTRDNGIGNHRKRMVYSFSTISIVVLISVFGWVLTDNAGKNTDRIMRSTMLSRALAAASTVDSEKVKLLSGTKADLDLGAYKELKQHLETIHKTSFDCRYIYMMALNPENKMIFLVDSAFKGDEDYSIPGELYDEATQALKDIFSNGKAFVEGPVSDKWGVWVSGLAPIWDLEQGTVVAVIGMDVDASQWQAKIFKSRSLVILLIMGVYLLLLLFGFVQVNILTTERIKASERNFRAIFENAPEGVFIFDIKTHKIMVGNAYMVALLGYSRQEITSLYMEDILPAGAAGLQENIRKTLTEGILRIKERKYRRKDGSWVSVEVTGEKFVYNDVACILIFLRDITQRLRFEKRITCLNECLIGFVSDPDSNIASLTVLCAELLGADAALYNRLQETSAQTISQWQLELNYNHKANLQRRVCLELADKYSGRAVVLNDIQNTLIAQEDLNIIEYGFKTYIGKPVKFTNNYVGVISLYYNQEHALDDEDEKFISIIASAVSVEEARRAADVALLAAKNRLEQDVYARTIDLAEANKYLQVEILEHRKAEEELRKSKELAEHASKAKSDFVSHISHEIRTPLNGIIGLAELISDTDPSEEQKELIEAINHETQMLLEIINQILDYSKIEAGKMELDMIPFDLRSSWNALVDIYTLRANQKGLELISEFPQSFPSQIIGDPSRIKEIIVNLAGNALKFTRQGHILMRTEIINQTAETVCVRFTITDTGIGIPQEKQATIFESFTQVDNSTSRKYGGTGLGTTIAKQLVELMAGRIGFISQEDKGATFWFEIAFRKASQEIGVVRPGKIDISRVRILFLTNNRTRQVFLNRHFNSWGCHLEKVNNETVALEILREAVASGQPFTLLIVDYNDIDKDKLKFIAQIRQHAQLAYLPVIALVAIGKIGDAKICLEQGIQGYVTKPIDPKELYKVVVSVVNIPLEEGKVPQQLVTKHSVREQYNRNIRILLTDDYPINQQVIMRHLVNQGYLVDIAENGAQALEMFKVNDYSLVLMDIQMPIMDGYQAVQLIREYERQKGRHVPVIALTAFAVKDYIDKCIDSGMDDYLIKPIVKKSLLSMIDKWIMGEADLGNKLPDQSQAAQESKVFDYQRALEEFGNDRKFLLEMLAGFLDSIAKQLEVICSALERNDRDTISKQAHAIKGGAANITASELAQVAAQLEDITTDDLAGLGQQLVIQLQSSYQKLKGYYQGLIK